MPRPNTGIQHDERLSRLCYNLFPLFSFSTFFTKQVHSERRSLQVLGPLRNVALFKQQVHYRTPFSSSSRSLTERLSLYLAGPVRIVALFKYQVLYGMSLASSSRSLTECHLLHLAGPYVSSLCSPRMSCTEPRFLHLADPLQNVALRGLPKRISSDVPILLPYTPSSPRYHYSIDFIS